MYKYTRAWLFEGGTVVLNKSDIHNAKDEQFQEVTLLIPLEFIKESYEDLDMLGEFDEEEDDCEYGDDEG